jgi:hypothetical protein
VHASILAGSLVVEVILISFAAAELEFTALLRVSIEMPLGDVLRTSTVEWSKIAGADSIVAKTLAILLRFEVIFVSIATCVEELTANSVSSVVVKSSVSLLAVSRGIWQHTGVFLSVSDWWSARFSWRLGCFSSSGWLLLGRLWSWLLLVFLATGFALSISGKSIVISTTSSVVELSTSLNLRVKVPIRHISLTISDISGKLACVFD